MANMRNNLKHFLIGALIAAVPMSYVVYNNIPHKPAVTMIKTPQNTLRAEEFLWSSKLSSPKKAVKLSSVNLNIQVSAWTFTNTLDQVNMPIETPTPTSEASPSTEPWDIFSKDTPSGKASSLGSSIPEYRDSGNSESVLKPTLAPKPTRKPEPKPQSQTEAYVIQSQPAPSDVDTLIEMYATEYGVNKDMMVHIAKCESGFRSNAVNGPYAGIYQFVASTWSSNRRAMGLDPDPTLRYNLEEAVKTAAFKMSRDGYGAWPVCQNKARRLLGLNSQGI